MPETLIHFTEFEEKSRINKAKIETILGNYLIKRELGQKNPVLDFLFEYYSFRPALLQRYSLGFDVGIHNESTFYNQMESIPHFEHFRLESKLNAYIMDVDRFPRHRLDSLDWVIHLLDATQQREPKFNCLGLHEWAMVYFDEDSTRHPLPLRLSIQETRKVVESKPLNCSHYDAYRFFTASAKPLNHSQISKVDRVNLEQSGCIHANMDVYRWAFTYYPWISTDLITEAFEAAVDARIIDMSASPYSVQEIGLKPIRIETKDGIEEYIEQQKRFYAKVRPIRQKLIEQLRRFQSLLRSN